MLAGNILNNSSYKKVRSISEGNFHSCYASNKAEKFKFSRLSQGLESCAQAQALKLRKEEKELRKLYQNIEKVRMIFKYLLCKIQLCCIDSSSS